MAEELVMLKTSSPDRNYCIDSEVDYDKIEPADLYLVRANKERANKYQGKFITESQVAKHMRDYRAEGRNYAIFLRKKLSYEMIKKLIDNGYFLSRDDRFIRVEW